MTNTTESSDTDILFSKQVMWYKKKVQAFAGVLKIDKSHISFEQNKIRSGGGLLGALISGKSKNSGAMKFSEPLKDVTFKKGRKMGKKNYILEIHLLNNEQYDILFDDSLLAEVEDLIVLSE